MAEAVSLDTYLKELRRQLVSAAVEGEGQTVRFIAEEVSVELEIAAERTGENGGDVNFKVFGVGFGAKAGAADTQGSTQKLTLKLRPVDAKGVSLLVALEGRKPD